MSIVFYLYIVFSIVTTTILFSFLQEARREATNAWKCFEEATAKHTALQVKLKKLLEDT